MRSQQKAPLGPFSWLQRWRSFSRAQQLGVMVGVVAVVFACLAALWWLWAAADPADERVTLAPQTAARTPPKDPWAFVPSQRGTVPDGKLAAASSKDDDALPFGELRRTFDYYLSAVGEQDIPAITRQIGIHLDAQLSAPKAQRARRLLDAYIAFRRALVGLDAKPDLSGTAVAAVKRRSQAQLALRAQYFTAQENEGMFGFEDAYDLDAIARLQVSQDASLSAADKQKKLAELDATMPAAVRAERDASVVVIRVEQQALEMRAKGASDDDIYRMRAREFDAGAAARLASLDAEEASWKRRIAAYLEARSLLLKRLVNATPLERSQALAELQQSLFSSDERRRLPAYEPAE
jgi:lipase chaperone LimK